MIIPLCTPVFYTHMHIKSVFLLTFSNVKLR